MADNAEIEISDEVWKMLQPGEKVRDDKHIYHIRAIVDDEFFVYRIWSRKEGWRYYIEWIYTFQLKFERGVLSPAKEAVGNG